jgi:hypothetical protein
MVSIENHFMSRTFTTLFFITSSVFVFSSCTSNEIGSSNDVNPDAVYFDYKVWGEEGTDDVTVMLQYRFGGSNGTTLVLDEPAKVQLDGQLINTDSSKMTGAFYEVMKPLVSFTGNHKILFTDINKKEYEEEFNFRPFKLAAEVPAELKRGELVFDFEGLDPVDYVRVFARDTSFESNDINRIDTVKNGRITLSVYDLDNLVNGPIHIQFYKEDEKPVKAATKEGGRIAITYGLKREFELKD